MKLPSRSPALLILAMTIVALTSACTGGGAGSGPIQTAASPSVERPAGSGPEPSALIGSQEPSPSSVDVSLDQAWAVGSLVDSTSGESFRIADHAGKVVIVETMAIWCSSCLAQQQDVETALTRLPADMVVFVVLDVDPNESAASLAAYRAKHGFTGRYAVAGKDVARALAAEFGDQFLNPPSTPMLVIEADGTVTRTHFGHKSVDAIVALALAHGA